MTGDPTGRPAPAAPPRDRFLRANRVTLVAGAAAVALAVAVYLATPNQHGLTSVWVLLFHLTPFVAAAVAIAWLDPGWSGRLRLHLILPTLCFLVFFTYFVPSTFVAFRREDRAEGFDELYYTQLMLVPFIVLALVLCLRLGGAGRATVLRTAAALMLVQLSGVEDLTVLILWDLSTPEPYPIPEVWTWADHIAVRIGHHPTRNEAYVFIAVHLVAAVAVLAVPGRAVRAAGRGLRALVRRGRPDPTGTEGG